MAPDGSALARSAVIGTLRQVTGCLRSTEHSMRRMGAQYYSRKGVAVPIIQFLVRWGGPTVLKYIGETLRERASFASIGPTLCDLRQDLKSASAPSVDGMEIVRVLENWERTWKQHLSAQQEWLANSWIDQQRAQLGGVARGSVVKVHEVVVGDAAFPIDVWVTRCGWRFGRSAHVRKHANAVTCSRCLKLVAPQVGGAGLRPRVA